MPPLVIVAIAWIAGLVAAHHLLVPAGLDPLSLLLLSLLPAAGLILWSRDRSMRLASTCVLAVFLGALRYQTALPDLDDPGHVAHYNGLGWAEVDGVVATYPDVRDTWTNLVVEASSIETEGLVHPVSGKLLVRAPRYPEYAYGDRLLVAGFLEVPPVLEGFSYRDYLARRGIYSLVRRPRIERISGGQGHVFWEAIYALKDRARDVIARILPEPQAALLQGILLGIESGIPRSLMDDFNATGTSHIIVISGFNIAIISALFARLFGTVLGKRRAYVFTIAGIVVYVLLVGAGSVVVRAGLMGALYVTARHLGRRSTAYVSLFASAIFLTLVNPLALWDAGFQLSFAATLGLILFTAPLERITESILTRVVSPDRAGQLVHMFSDVLIVTLAAQVFTTPLVAFTFARVSLVAPLANLLILSVQPLIMTVGGVATLLGLVPILGPLAQIVGWLPWLGLAYTTAVVQWLASWPLASIPANPPLMAALLALFALLAVLLWRVGRRRVPPHPGPKGIAIRRSTVLLVVGPAIGVLLVGLAFSHLPDGRLHVAFLDVGQGDAILITTPRGQQVLVDGGPSPAALTSALAQQMPFWDRSIDLLVLTHPDSDHLTGLVEVLDRFQVDAWLDNGQATENDTYHQCQALLDEHKVRYHAAQAGETLDLGQGWLLEVLHPPAVPLKGTSADSNNNSVVVRLVGGGASILLTGDVEAQAEGLLLRSRQGLRADVLKVAHHGSGGSSTAEFLDAVDPALAVISVGADNLAGHPAPETLERLADLDVSVVLRTDERGTVEVIVDAYGMSVRTEQ